MTIGGSLLLIAIGAILKYAVTAHVSGVNLGTVGVILMVVGIAGLLISLIWLASARRRHSTVVAQQTYSRAPLPPQERAYQTRVEERRYQDPPL